MQNTLQQLENEARIAREKFAEAERKERYRKDAETREASRKKKHDVWLPVFTALAAAMNKAGIEMTVTPSTDSYVPTFKTPSFNFTPFTTYSSGYSSGYSYEPGGITVDKGFYGRGNKVNFPIRKDGTINVDGIVMVLLERIRNEAQKDESDKRRATANASSRNLKSQLTKELGLRDWSVIKDVNAEGYVAFEFTKTMTGDEVRAAVKALRDAGFKVE